MAKKMTATVEELIEEVKNFPVLFDRLNQATSGAQINEEKAIAWRKISENLGNEDTIDVLKAKWRNLRDSFMKAVKNRRELEEIGQLHRYHGYKHEEKLEFLYQHVLAEIGPSRKRKASTISSYTPNIKVRKPETKVLNVFKLEESSPYQSEEFIEETYEEEIDAEEISLGKGIYDEESAENENSFDDQLQEKFTNYQQEERIEKSPNEEEIDDFLRDWLNSIKASMIKLTKLNQARAKRDINAILSNYEIEQLESGNS